MDAQTRQRYLDRIVADRDVIGGKARVAGTRISVAHILDCLAGNMSPAQIVEAYPTLTEEDVKATLVYASELAHESVWRIARTS